MFGRADEVRVFGVGSFATAESRRWNAPRTLGFGTMKRLALEIVVLGRHDSKATGTEVSRWTDCGELNAGRSVTAATSTVTMLL